MSSWGVNAVGINALKKEFDRLSVQFSGNATYVVGPTVAYAIHHERGTRSMAARPFMRPAAERVSANIMQYAKRMSSSQGIPLTSERNIIRCVALAVQNQAQIIADQKGVRDTGALIASIDVREVS